jgi:hypothetical protein
MSGIQQVLYMILAYTGLCGLLYLFYIKLVSKKEEEEV